MNETSTLLEKLNHVYAQINMHASAIHHYLESFKSADARQAFKNAADDLEKIRKAVSALTEQSERLKTVHLQAADLSEKLTTLRHDLRSPVNGIKGYSEIILETMEESHQTVFASTFFAITGIAQQILRAIDEVREEHPVQSDIVAELAVPSTPIIPVPETKPKPEPIKKIILEKKAETIPDSHKKAGVVLVVDDTEIDREQLAEWVSHKGYQVITADNGNNALTLIEKNKNTNMVLLDVKMPGMSGTDVLRYIKSHKEYASIPVIMISGVEDINEIANCIRAGAEDYLIKPFNAFLLSARMETCIEQKKLYDLRHQRVPSPLSTKYMTAFGKRELEQVEKRGNIVLVVDDLASNRDLLSDWLMKKHYRVITAADGYEALKILDQNENIDVILLDVMMPGLDGYEVLQRIKSTKTYADAPVIMISAMDEMDTIVRCIKIGAEDYLTKPFNSFLLSARISACVEKKQLHDKEKAYVARIEEEMNIAQHIQLSMLPSHFPESKSFSIYGQSIPAKEVGGDFYDYYFFPEGKIGFTIGDVSGKGIPAALFMAVSRTILYSLATSSKTPESYLGIVNELLQKENEAMMFVTLFYGMLDQASGVLTYVNCGHLLPILFHANGTIELLGVNDGSALGVIKDVQLHQHTTTIAPGDLIFLYTDGITEAMNKSNAEYGIEKLMRTVKKSKQRDPKTLIQNVIEDVNDFVAGQDQYDDITALSLLFKEHVKE